MMQNKYISSLVTQVDLAVQIISTRVAGLDLVRSGVGKLERRGGGGVHPREGRKGLPIGDALSQDAVHGPCLGP